MQSTLELLDAPGVLDAAPFDTTGKTVGQVVDQICRKLRKTELEPEWVVVANYAENANDATFGAKPDAPWPETDGRRSRLCLSVSIGRSEGWLVQIDHVHFVEEGGGSHWLSQPLVRAKVLNRSLAWSIAAVVSRLLDID
ncbi:hypothetical protein M3I54_36070 [Paraburkholderia sp. CNPSo 3274]|uniref:hypothetical protein n=1 Tax=unclassified Paraburkholderia TaxID=2615204 RepID=UPI0020B8069A|nr:MULTISPECIES: hypothetical protein [unclassified Paraburkholderia]MCP3712300.1 hypothetical protein [Paraburkholderia sp. CNPSo 3274]MCP3718475.1 hypothetical protein [Paraburkholderia sp. CNPSo 3281]MCP3724640.1 hypothetical protein [Paraburkholderia sp. CNPSo 3272]